MRRLLLVVGLLFGACAGSASCSASERVNLADAPPPPANEPSFTDPTDPDASVPDAGENLLQCIATECPDGWTTCTSLTAPTFKCGTDLMRDNKNCGACGNECGNHIDDLNMTSRCVDGVCEYQCYKHYSNVSNEFEDWTDCNGLIEDGCEANLTSDPNNCGVCGNKCGPGVPCIDGACGCPTGLILCDGKCVDPNFDPKHCGGCGNECTFPDDACSPLQPHTTYTCIMGECGKKTCAVEWNVQYHDCNGDLFANTCDGDGCEVAGLTSKEHCGACGNRCEGDEECVNEGNGYECAIPCVRSGMVLCGNTCRDLLTDPKNCGTCGNECRQAGKNDNDLNELSSCKEGLCVYECMPGFGDCNDDPSDGCETDLRVHPQHCGACGVACDVAAGQPCIEGKCLMEQCEDEVTR